VRRRNGSLVLLLALLALAALLPVVGRPAAAQTDVAPIAVPSLSMGFGPGLLTPTSQGVPVYTAGDQLWVSSDSSASLGITLTDPGGVTIASTALLPMDPAIVHSFSGSEPTGVWSLTVGPGSSENQSQPVEPQTVQFLVVQAFPDPATLSGYSLSAAGGLAMNFTLPTTVQYDIDACAVGTPQPTTASVPIPSALGSGQILLGEEGASLSIATKGLVSAPFEFWVELDQNYSYLQGLSPTSVVSRSIEVASTSATALVPDQGSTTAFNASLSEDAQLRAGRLELRAFFDSSVGISVEQTWVLSLGDGSWMPLQGCSAYGAVSSRSFSLSASLTGPVSGWPAAVYTTYDVYGVEMFSASDVGLEPAVLSVDASPWGTSLTDSLLNFSSPGGAELASSPGNGTLYLVSGQYPVDVVVSTGTQPGFTVTIAQPFTETEVQVNSSKLSVATYLGTGGRAAGASIAVLDAGGQPVATAASGGQSPAVFYLPPGNYTVRASLGNSTQVEVDVSQPGVSSAIAFHFATGSGTDVVYLLETAAVGLVASIVVWVKVYRDRR
jgi:hypothetical protein